MNPSIIRFHHFTTKKAYCNLQEIFGSYDERRNYDVIEEPIEDFEITYYERDELFATENYTQLFYRKDFLIPGILELKHWYFENFKEASYDKGLFSEELLNGFAKFHRNKIIETKAIIFRAKYLSLGTRFDLISEMNKLQALIDDFVENPYPKVKSKVQFNWIRTDVEYFFYLLRTNDQIAWIEDADFGRIIDGAFQCVEGDEIKEITGSRKHLNAFKNDAGRSEDKAIKRLKSIFQNDDFYNI